MKRNRHFRAVIDVIPGRRHEVRMTVDKGNPPWVSFHIKGSRSRFALPLTEVMVMCFRAAQKRYCDHELGTEQAGREGDAGSPHV